MKLAYKSKSYIRCEISDYEADQIQALLRSLLNSDKTDFTTKFALDFFHKSFFTQFHIIDPAIKLNLKPNLLPRLRYRTARILGFSNGQIHAQSLFLLLIS